MAAVHITKSDLASDSNLLAFLNHSKAGFRFGFNDERAEVNFMIWEYGHV